MRVRALTLVALGALTSGCVFKQVNVREVSTAADGQIIESPVKLHLLDGSTVVYPDGATVTEVSVDGTGNRFDLALRSTGDVTSVPLDSVSAMEAYFAETNATATALGSTMGVLAGAAAVSAAAVAVFGSCPTVYSDSAGIPLLEAESFSYSIAPLFEARDVDRLVARASGADADVVTLEIRNEALETHYLNHLELLEVEHPPRALVVPDAEGAPLVVRDLRPPVTARDRAGRDRRADVAHRDDRRFHTDSSLLAAASVDDLEDWLDLTFPVPGGAESVALVLRLQNSLLTTVLFYDVMLAELGPAAVDWITRDLGRIDTAVEVGRWARQQLGLRIEVFDGTAFVPTGWLRDVGPIAPKDVAFVVPVPEGESDTIRVRLRFTADNWRIDQVGVASWQPTVARTVPLARVVGADGVDDPSALAAMAVPDERYLQTRPGQRFFAHFDVGPMPAAGDRTFLLASQGYYVEWLRRGWLAPGSASVSEGFQPGPDAVYRAVARWRDVQEEAERSFYASRIPVR